MVYSLSHKKGNIFTNFYHSPAWKILIYSFLIAIIGGLAWLAYDQNVIFQQAQIAQVEDRKKVDEEMEAVKAELETLKAEDQRVKNKELQDEIKNIERVYETGAKLFDDRADLVIMVGKVYTVDKELAKFLRLLGDRKWQEAETQAKVARSEIDKIVAANVPKPTVTEAAPSNTLPGSGYSRQKVSTDRGEFVISMVTAQNARAVVETASDSDCSNNCPTKSLAEHVAASGGFAGINGSYFCPPDYAACQGKVNSFDTLAVNGRTKAVLNSANNVYSTVPLVAAYGTRLTFYDQTVQWGKDASGGGGIANYPRLLRDGAVATSDNSGKGVRGFIAQKDDTIVIGHVYNASFADTAEVLKTLGLKDALNLDGGGSTALWFGGYKAGPGRSLPTAIVLVR
jgi:hypothetical protein